MNDPRERKPEEQPPQPSKDDLQREIAEEEDWDEDEEDEDEDEDEVQ